MKKYLLWTFMLPIALVMFAACEKGDDSDDPDDSFKVTIQNVQTSLDGISEVRAVTYNWTKTLTSCQSGGVMELNLPPSIAPGFLSMIKYTFTTAYFQISDPTAMFASAYIHGYKADGTKAGTFEKYSSTDLVRQNFYYWYADKDVTVKGLETFEYDGRFHEMYADFSLKKGWNVICQKNYLTKVGENVYETFSRGYANGSAVSGDWYFIADEE